MQGTCADLIPSKDLAVNYTCKHLSSVIRKVFTSASELTFLGK